MKFNMIIVAILVLRFLVKLRFPVNTPISVWITQVQTLQQALVYDSSPKKKIRLRKVEEISQATNT